MIYKALTLILGSLYTNIACIFIYFYIVGCKISCRSSSNYDLYFSFFHFMKFQIKIINKYFLLFIFFNYKKNIFRFFFEFFMLEK